MSDKEKCDICCITTFKKKGKEIGNIILRVCRSFFCVEIYQNNKLEYGVKVNNDNDDYPILSKILPNLFCNKPTAEKEIIFEKVKIQETPKKDCDK